MSIKLHFMGIEARTDGSMCLQGDVEAHYFTDEVDEVIPGTHITVPIPAQEFANITSAFDTDTDEGRLGAFAALCTYVMVWAEQNAPIPLPQLEQMYLSEKEKERINAETVQIAEVVKLIVGNQWPVIIPLPEEIP